MSCTVQILLHRAQDQDFEGKLLSEVCEELTQLLGGQALFLLNGSPLRMTLLCQRVQFHLLSMMQFILNLLRGHHIHSIEQTRGALLQTSQRAWFLHELKASSIEQIS